MKKNNVLTIHEVYIEWRKLRNEEIKISTTYVEENAFKKFIKKYGEKNITEITSQDLQNFLFNQQISRETRKLRKSYYKLFFDYALKVGYIEVNPVNQVILPKSRVTLEEINRKKNKFLTRREMKMLLDYISTRNVHKDKGMLFEFLD